MDYEKPEIERIAPLEEHQLLFTELRFDCRVTSRNFGVNRANKLPQWFQLKQKPTLEFIKYSDEYTIGRAIKQGLSKLEEAIENYENNKL